MTLVVGLSLVSTEIKRKYHRWHQPPDDSIECNLQQSTATLLHLCISQQLQNTAFRCRNMYIIIIIIIINYYYFRRRHCHIGLSAPEFSEFTVCVFKEMMTAKCPSVHIMYNSNSVKELSVERVAIDGICPMFHEFSKGILRYWQIQLTIPRYLCKSRIKFLYLRNRLSLSHQVQEISYLYKKQP